MPFRSTAIAAFVALTTEAPALAGQIAYTGAVTTFTVAQTGTYSFLVEGAGGGANLFHAGGSGEKITGNLFLTANTVLSIVVGGAGSAGDDSGVGGGGGGTFIYAGTTPFLIAGGGGGAGNAFNMNIDATSSQDGRDARGSSGGLGGTNGNGGAGGNIQEPNDGGGGGGAGFYGSGGDGDGSGNYPGGGGAAQDPRSQAAREGSGRAASAGTADSAAGVAGGRGGGGGVAGAIREAAAARTPQAVRVAAAGPSRQPASRIWCSPALAMPGATDWSTSN